MFVLHFLENADTERTLSRCVHRTRVSTEYRCSIYNSVFAYKLRGYKIYNQICVENVRIKYTYKMFVGKSYMEFRHSPMCTISHVQHVHAYTVVFVKTLDSLFFGNCSPKT